MRLWSFLRQSQIAFNAGLRQEIESINHIVFGADTVDAPKSLDKPDGIPVQVVVDDLVAVLEIQSFRQNIRGHNRRQLAFTGLKSIFRIGSGREPSHHARLALVAAVDDLDVVALAAGIQILEQVTRRVGVLGEDEALSLFEWRFSQSLLQRLELGVLFGA